MFGRQPQTVCLLGRSRLLGARYVFLRSLPVVVGNTGQTLRHCIPRWVVDHRPLAGLRANLTSSGPIPVSFSDPETLADDIDGRPGSEFPAIPIAGTDNCQPSPTVLQSIAKGRAEPGLEILSRSFGRIRYPSTHNGGGSITDFAHREKPARFAAQVEALGQLWTGIHFRP